MTRSTVMAGVLSTLGLGLAADPSAAQEKGGRVNNVKPAIVLITGAACRHHVEPPSERLKKNQESLGWEVRNFCPHDQKVLFCMYLAGKLKNPFDPCTPDPADRDIGKIFEVPGKGGRKDLTCLATGDYANYLKVVFTGTDVPTTGCPPKPPAAKPHAAKRPAANGPGIRTHRLDVEIIP